MKTENFTALRRKETHYRLLISMCSPVWDVQEYIEKISNVNMIKRKYVCMLTDEFYHAMICSLYRSQIHGE